MPAPLITGERIEKAAWRVIISHAGEGGGR